MSSEPVSDWNETARRVGWIAIASARLEFALGVLEIELLDTERAAAVVLGQGWTANREGCLALLRHRIGDAEFEGADTTALRELTSMIQRADRLMTDRSHVVHALWGPIGMRTQHSSQLKRWGKSRVAEWTPAALDQLRADLDAVYYEITEATTAVVDDAG